MFVELIDLLRCPRPHEDTWLVATAEETAARHIVRGTLGCPVCRAEFPIVDAVADFGEAPDAANASGSATTAVASADVGEDDVVRIAALLDLTAPGGTVALGGDWQLVAPVLAELTRVRVLLLDPRRPEPLVESVSAVRGGGGLPVAAGSLRGVALDAHTADAPRLAAAARALAPRGRLVAPAAAPLPAGVAELARDDALWVAERPTETVRLERRGGRGA